METLARLGKRGPDGHGVYHGVVGAQAVTLLHTRLAVIDLGHAADQPMERDGCVLVFNGEIYNYLELRRDLEALAHTFRTHSDTEVLMAAYQEWGLGCLDKLEGMWAFALFDPAKGQVILSRDRFGEKPLFYRTCQGTVYFASEPKALASISGVPLQVNGDQVRRYLVNGFRSLFKKPETFFDAVHEVPPAHTISLSSAGVGPTKPYWNLRFQPTQMSHEEAVAGVSARLDRALEIRLRSDVPLAFCLSGGVDSTSIAAIAARRFGQKIHTFSVIDQDERYNERENIDAFVKDLGCENHLIHTSTDGFFDRMEDLIAYYDAPVPTISYYVHSFLSQEIRARGYKVAMSGTGADEIFTGYYDHYSYWLANMHGRDDFDQLINDWKGSYGAHVNNPKLQDPLTFVRNPAERGHLYLNREVFNSFMVEAVTEDFSEDAFCGDTLRNRMMNELKHEIVPVILRADDSNSMMWSVENRSPFLDRELVEFLYKVPNERLIHGGYPKWLLRTAVAGVVPDQIRLDRRKRGFNASIDSMVDRTDSKTRDRLLEPSPIFDYVQRDAIERFLSEDMTDNSFSKFLFSFISAKMFLEAAPALSGPPEKST